ncbi:MAG: hypothetical protein KKH94_11325 [Candidatus Omnitrophica bacterium]|nr:hypothetical protein [Candidatus Omnitrophota bacterium]
MGGMLESPDYNANKFADASTDCKATSWNYWFQKIKDIFDEIGVDIKAGTPNLKTRLAVAIENNGTLKDYRIVDNEVGRLNLDGHAGQKCWQKDINAFYVSDGMSWIEFARASQIVTFKPIDEFHTDVDSPENETEFDIFVTTLPANTLSNIGEKIKADYFIEGLDDGYGTPYYGIFRVYFNEVKILEEEAYLSPTKLETINVKIIRAETAGCVRISSNLGKVGGYGIPGGVTDVCEITWTEPIELKVTVQRYDEYSGLCRGKMGEVEWIASSQ